jgi:hypothetical protein
MSGRNMKNNYLYSTEQKRTQIYSLLFFKFRKKSLLLFLLLTVLSLGIADIYCSDKAEKVENIKAEYMEIINNLDESEQNRLLNLRKKNARKFRIEVLRIQSQRNKQEAIKRKKEIIEMLKNYGNEQDETKKTEIMKEVKKKIAEDLAGKIKINEAKIKKLSYRLENLKKTIEFYKEHKDAAVDKTFQSLIKAAGITKNK